MKLNSQNVRRKLNNSSGFTLIELLVVIIILGILSGIVIVSVGGARDKAVNNSCKADAVALRGAIDRYYIDNGVYPTTTTANTYYGAADLAPLTTASAYLRTLPPLLGDAAGKNYYLDVEITKGTSPAVTAVGTITGYQTNANTGTAIPGCVVA